MGLNELPEIHQFLDGFYLSRIGIRILIGQHIALHDPPREDHIGPRRAIEPLVIRQSASGARLVKLSGISLGVQDLEPNSVW